MLGLLIPRRVYIALAVIALAGAAATWLRVDAVRGERARVESEQLRQQAETLERINDAISDDRTPDDIRQRLRDLAQ